MLLFAFKEKYIMHISVTTMSTQNTLGVFKMCTEKDRDQVGKISAQNGIYECVDERRYKRKFYSPSCNGYCHRELQQTWANG